jgi:hypothetical protein
MNRYITLEISKYAEHFVIIFEEKGQKHQILASDVLHSHIKVLDLLRKHTAYLANIMGHYLTLTLKEQNLDITIFWRTTFNGCQFEIRNDRGGSQSEQEKIMYEIVRMPKILETFNSRLEYTGGNTKYLYFLFKIHMPLTYNNDKRIEGVLNEKSD